ncbi:hypothetical protein MLD38_024997 [Melastoma candidum]|uniref:Uncharacterized protein n=1 Tax=Melastoma candidum TaxID=119954 RepID=A0ACB9NX36_9MYRT|nr:hypothetical protein MLD38_024997 [Melastoma candidum]
MGCVSSKQAVTVTPAFDHSGQFKDKAGGFVVGKDGCGSRSKCGFWTCGFGPRRRGEGGWELMRGRNDATSGRGKDGGSGRVADTESTSFRLGNLHKYVEGEQVAAGWPAWLSAVAGEAIQGWVPLRSDGFEKLEKIGQGTYSSVFRARELDTETLSL